MTHEQFNQIVMLLGGLRSVQRNIKVSYRTLQYYAAGTKPVAPGVIRLLKTALIAHSQLCLAAAQDIIEPPQ